jgi:hypothetical protein
MGTTGTCGSEGASGGGAMVTGSVGAEPAASWPEREAGSESCSRGGGGEPTALREEQQNWPTCPHLKQQQH